MFDNAVAVGNIVVAVVDYNTVVVDTDGCMLYYKLIGFYYMDDKHVVVVVVLDSLYNFDDDDDVDNRNHDYFELYLILQVVVCC